MFYAIDVSADEIELDPNEARHALGSRRMRDGEQVAVFDGRGSLAHGRLTIVGSGKQRTARVAVVERRTVARPERAVRLFTAAPKGDRLRFLVEKCTELGAGELHFVRWSRSVVEPTSVDKLERVAIEACKQCGRLWLPEIRVDVTPEAFLQQAPPLYFGHCDGVAAAGDRGLSLVFAVGPEGGFSAEEVERFRAAGAEAVSLGPHVLRTETAAIAACAAGAASAK